MLRRLTVIVPLSPGEGVLTDAQSTLDFEQFDYEIGSYRRREGDFIDTTVFVGAMDFHEAGIVLDKLTSVSPCINYLRDGSGNVFKYDRVTRTLTRCYASNKGDPEAIRFTILHKDFYFVEGS
ncbi:hypothetical protein QLL94_gp08 [Pectobacterium phage PP2]|uniref:Uncharacterized protein n=1 Tax=Pectobacterium phage PP2 TaxID=1897743 RepID=A0A1W5P4Y7_9CAUD|nr:hypothetical protein QLL94_gp08 [Pectobacterium phage PP2]AOT25374.1 hypothetical protein PP2_008 [Pectobacterium phage PP2]